MTWILVICFGPSWLGCSAVEQVKYPTYETCIQAMEIYTKQDANAVCKPAKEQPSRE